MADSTVAAAPTGGEDDSLGLPDWLEDLLKPGVGQGVFMTLKVSLLGLILTLTALLFYLEDPARASATQAASCAR